MTKSLSSLHIYHLANNCNPLPMNIDQIRRNNLLLIQGKRSQSAVAELWGTSASTLSQITSKNAKRNLGKPLARRIELAEGLPEGWMDIPHHPGSEGFALLKKENLASVDLAALLDAEIGNPGRPESNAELIGMMSPWDDSTPLHSDEVAIPLFKEVEMAGGSGATEVIEVPGRLLRFAKSTLREAGVEELNAACATVRGRSMERLIMDGATIGIDRGSTHIEDGEIYAFDHEGMLRVKYLYRLPGGGLRVRSENSEEFPDEIIGPEAASEIRILGWVFWWSTVRRKRGLRLAK
ncbi:S24 family peptidase [Pseudomonas nitroreducens]|uniref:S24 family peptidase n=1 Tax=Pseudomonas nitroreducens TaxID=46680 RepID=UPI002D7E7936|nr:helix-turn-helix transcriptional regulator [Pseudomonas nitroreducens]